MSAPEISILTIPPPGQPTTQKVLAAYQASDPDPLYAHPNPGVRHFADALAVRAAVFVREQACPWADEVDADDARAWHLVARDAETQKPLATLRIVPGPHAAHPRPGSVDGVGGEHVRVAGGGAGAGGEDGDEGAGKGAKARDVRTKMHDGRERYVKIGRVATVREARGRGLAGRLMREAERWAGANREELQGSEGEENGDGVGKEWNGLVMVHAQKDVVPMYEKAGFEVDGELGEWMEVGIPHVALWKRLQL